MAKILNKELVSEPVKPFLRWAGGKSWLIKHLSNIKITDFSNYHEPFLGGASTYFYLSPPKKSFLSDLNEDLIETYIQVRDNAKEVIKRLKTFENSAEYYYEIRSTNFNNAIDKAARFIYLNQTSYNGIYRVNLKGVYNVPFGYRTKDYINENSIMSAQEALSNATIKHGDFYDIIDNVFPGDLVFLDPPYTVSHNLNGFIKYNEKIFSLDDQIRLAKLIDEIKQKGAFYILTNAAHKTIEKIFDKGDRKLILNRASLIGGLKSTRGQTSEFIFTNTDL